MPVDRDEVGNASFYFFTHLAGMTSSLTIGESGTLTESLKAKFQPADDPSDSPFTEIVGQAKRTYMDAPASHRTLTYPSDVLQVTSLWQRSSAKRYAEEGVETST